MRHDSGQRSCLQYLGPSCAHDLPGHERLAMCEGNEESSPAMVLTLANHFLQIDCGLLFFRHDECSQTIRRLGQMLGGVGRRGGTRQSQDRVDGR